MLPRKKKLKEFVFLHCKLDAKVNEMLERLCADTGLSKTAAVERALKRYYEYYKRTGKS